jgi:hypothetical protein
MKVDEMGNILDLLNVKWDWTRAFADIYTQYTENIKIAHLVPSHK